MAAVSKRILMCRPDHFKVSYVINPWMMGVKPVDQKLAMQQWTNLKNTLEKCGAKIEVMGQVEGLPDMVFTANAAVVYKKKAFVAHFMHKERQPEAGHFKKWFDSHGFQTFTDTEIPFEGAGDALFAGSKKLFAAYGPRTDVRIYDRIKAKLNGDFKLITSQLVDPRWYHIDTAFCPLTPELAIWYPRAFAEESRKKLENEIELIEISQGDASNFACNMIVVGTNVVLHANNKDTVAKLGKRGFEAHSVDVSEFIKAGGACKCLTLAIE